MAIGVYAVASSESERTAGRCAAARLDSAHGRARREAGRAAYS